MNITRHAFATLFTAGALCFAAPAFAAGDNGEGDNDSQPCEGKDLGDDCEQDDGDNGTCQKDEEGDDELFCDATACETDCDNAEGGDGDVDVDADDVTVGCSSAAATGSIGALAALLFALRRRR